MEISKVPVGLSACLAGHEVRYNGGHKQSKLCLDEFSKYFEFTPFCPEVAAGFGTPRPTMQLAGNLAKPILRYTNDQQSDLTQTLQNGFKQKLLESEVFDGYILIKNSPSCGLERVKVFQENGHPHAEGGIGLFASALQQRYPMLPLEEEGRLHDVQLRENFILRVFAHYNFRHEVLANRTAHALLMFHSSYKYVLMAQSQAAYKQLGKMLADIGNQNMKDVVPIYFKQFMDALGKPATRKNHVNTMFHVLGYLKRDVASKSRHKIVETIEDYRLGHVPLITPLTLLNHYIDQMGSEYIKAQRYLQPYPAQLGLRNKI